VHDDGHRPARPPLRSWGVGRGDAATSPETRREPRPIVRGAQRAASDVRRAGHDARGRESRTLVPSRPARGRLLTARRDNSRDAFRGISENNAGPSPHEDRTREAEKPAWCAAATRLGRPSTRRQTSWRRLLRPGKAGVRRGGPPALGARPIRAHGCGRRDARWQAESDSRQAVCLSADHLSPTAVRTRRPPRVKPHRKGHAVVHRSVPISVLPSATCRARINASGRSRGGSSAASSMTCRGQP
jgi:hypothetical protein